MQGVEHGTPVEGDSSTYHYEDYLADMGNAASTEGGTVEAGAPPLETEANQIGRLQAITGAKAVETKVKPRGPRADAADYPFILVCYRLAGFEIADAEAVQEIAVVVSAALAADQQLCVSGM